MRLATLYRKIFLNEKNPQGAKFFCVGLNKTGTTSLKNEFRRLHFKVGSQRQGELLFFEHYFKSEFRPILDFCKSAEFFQDLPFSCPETFKHLDQAFPSGKFILTIRDDPEQWYESLTQFHARLFGTQGQPPTVAELEAATYVKKGFMKRAIQLFGTSDSDPYNKKILVQFYINHVEAVKQFFTNRTQKLLVLNLSSPHAYAEFQDFMNLRSPFDSFRWDNKTSNVSLRNKS